MNLQAVPPEIHETDLPCDYFIIRRVRNHDLEVSIVDEVLNGVVDTFEHVRHGLLYMGNWFPKFESVMMVPMFVVSLPEFYVEFVRSIYRIYAYLVSSALGKQPWFREEEILTVPIVVPIPRSVALNCEWGEKTSTMFLTAQPGTCFYERAPIQTYPTGHALALGHTPWYFENMQNEWSRKLLFQNIWMSMENSLRDLWKVEWMKDSLNNHAREIIQRPFVHTQFGDAYSGMDSHSDLWPAFYC